MERRAGHVRRPCIPLPQLLRLPGWVDQARNCPTVMPVMPVMPGWVDQARNCPTVMGSSRTETREWDLRYESHLSRGRKTNLSDGEHATLSDGERTKLCDREQTILGKGEKNADSHHAEAGLKVMLVCNATLAAAGSMKLDGTSFNQQPEVCECSYVWGHR
eukprot:208387-Chlamydomonas_euryale.AAC.1